MNVAAPHDRWSAPPEEVLAAVESTAEGLSQREAARRLAATGRNELDGRRHRSALRILAAQLESPLVLLLVGAAALSLLVGSRDAR